MKILGISTSYRHNSNSKYALEKCFEKLTQHNIETKIYDMQKLNIKACHGCDYCKNNEEAKCAIQDDMQDIYEELKEADAIILASPIYMGQLTAQAKIFLDRLYAYFMSNWTEKYGKKDVAMIITQGQPGKDLYKTNIDTYIFNFENIVKFNVLGYEVLTENNIAGAIKDKPEQIQEATNIANLFIKE